MIILADQQLKVAYSIVYFNYNHSEKRKQIERLKQQAAVEMTAVGLHRFRCREASLTKGRTLLSRLERNE